MGVPVREIEFRGAAPGDLEHLRSLLVQRANEPLDKQKLRHSVQNLYATGRFADVQVEAEWTPQNDLRLVFVAEENYFVGTLTATGAPTKTGPNNHQLLNSSKLVLGQLFTKDDMPRALSSMTRLLQENGYYKATIAVTYSKHPETQQLDIHFKVDPGDQARIGNVFLEGSPELTPPQFMEAAKFRSGERATPKRLDDALRRMRKRYQKQDRLEAQASLVDRVYRPETNTVDYTFAIRPGPRDEIRVEGASISKGLLKKYVPVYEENAVDEDLLNEGRRNLRDYFQSRGYFDVKINVTEKEEPGRRLVVYDVDRGIRHKLVAVDIDWTNTITLPHNEPYFKADAIRERMLVRPAGRVLLQGLFSQSLLSQDQEAIASVYKANGFEQVKVTSDVQDDYEGSPGRMRVLVHIDEGPQTRVHSLKIVGNEHIPAEDIRGLINTVEGQAWSDFNIATDREAVTNFYFNNGFPEVTFEAVSKRVPDEPTRMDVTFNITEGKQVFVDRVLISGLNVTKPFVVGREIQVHNGDPLSQRAIIESQRNLYDLGIFNEVDIAVQNPEGDDTKKNVLFDIKEARRWTFNYGLGFEVQTGSEPNSTLPQGRTGISPRVSFDLSRINFRGRDHTLLFSGHVGRLEQRALFTYEAPRWFDRKNLKLRFISFYDNTNDIRTFTSQRLEGAAQIEQTHSRSTTFLYRLSYREVKAMNLVIDPLLVPLFSKPVRIGMPSFTYIHDTRDNPLDSHRGDYTTADMGVSSNIVGSQASFTRFLVQNSTYYSFGKPRIVLARSTRLGIENALANAATPQGIIPLPELLFAGGGNSHRGFSINQAGPRDLETGFPLGGEAMFLNNVELRLPAPWLPLLEDKLSPVVFWDFGNVFGSASDMFRSFGKVSQTDLNQCSPTAVIQRCDFNFMSHALGGGIRYNTPIGPVRFDLGYNLNPPTFLINSSSTVETLRHFNFFFSIGQTF